MLACPKLEELAQQAYQDTLAIARAEAAVEKLKSLQRAQTSTIALAKRSTLKRRTTSPHLGTFLDPSRRAPAAMQT